MFAGVKSDGEGTNSSPIKIPTKRMLTLLYISVLNFRSEAMFAFASIFGIIFPVDDVKSVVTPGP
jgi:hypothetical protein